MGQQVHGDLSIHLTLGLALTGFLRRLLYT